MDVISTAEVAAEDRFGFWREVNSKLWAPYDLSCDPEWENRFKTQVGVCDFGSVQATLITTVPHSIHRTPKLIRQSDPEVFKLGCVARGGGVITQDDQTVGVGAGDLALRFRRGQGDSPAPRISARHSAVPTAFHHVSSVTVRSD